MRWPATGNSSQKAADPSDREHRKEHTPSPRPSPGHAAADPSTSSEAGQDHRTVPGGGLDARYEQLRHAALHARAEAFPLGFAVLTRRGVTAWRHTLTEISVPDNHPPDPAPAASAAASALPGPIVAELVNALAAVALAGA